ncbi:MAG: SelB C-terminal domain-containing protein, partial [Fimbriimonas ginsengisoli]|nr:SelB C-terminal domain-containing protein [Fimbriimonas ginsengisoli]
LHDAQAGLPTEEVCRRLGKTPQALGDAFQALVASDQARGFAGLWFGASAFQQASERFLAVLAAIHDEEPMTPWQPREKAVTRAGLAWSGKPLDRIVSALAAEGYLEAAGTTIKAAGFRIRLTERQRRFLDRVRKELATSGVSPPTAHELAQRVAAPVQAIEEILKLGVQAGEVLSLGEGLFYTQEQITRIIADTARLAGSRPFTAAEFRDMHGTSRKYAIPLLEYFDSHRATTRVGDKRIVNEGQR